MAIASEGLIKRTLGIAIKQTPRTLLKPCRPAPAPVCPPIEFSFCALDRNNHDRCAESPTVVYIYGWQYLAEMWAKRSLQKYPSLSTRQPPF